VTLRRNSPLLLWLKRSKEQEKNRATTFPEKARTVSVNVDVPKGSEKFSYSNIPFGPTLFTLFGWAERPVSLEDREQKR